MDILKIKNDVFSYQRNGKWNASIEYLRHLQSSTQNMELDLLTISELYWLLENRDYFESNPSKEPLGYNDIIWDFDDYFIKAFSDSYGKYADVLFQWQIGLLISIDPTPFMIGYRAKDILLMGKDLSHKAVLSSSGTSYENLIRITNDLSPNLSDIAGLKEHLVQEVDSLNFQLNLSDEIMHDHLLQMIERYI